MANLFGEYELMAQSGLFDAAYYLGANPDVAAVSIDPLTHYLEKGAIELRNPSEAFDARFYVQQCRERGQQVENPLLHYIRTGAAQGLIPRPGEDSTVLARTDAGAASRPVTLNGPKLLLGLDRVRIQTGHGAARLSGLGWCLAASPIIQLEVKLGASGCRARYGLPRADVAQMYPQYLKADHSGFEFTLNLISEDQAGVVVELNFVAKTAQGDTARRSLPIDLVAIRAEARQQEPTTASFGDAAGFAGPPMQLCIDAAQVDDAGILHIEGWAVCLAPIDSVLVYIDEERLAAAEYGRLRDDVGANYRQYPNARDSGFAIHADVSSHSAGERLIKVQAIASTGISRETTLPLTFSGKRRTPSLRSDEIDSKVQCFCDLIEVTTGGRVSIKGWAVAATATERITVRLDFWSAEITGMVATSPGDRYGSQSRQQAR